MIVHAKPIVHSNTDTISDADLTQEATQYLARHASLQAMVEIMAEERRIVVASTLPDAQKLGWQSFQELRRIFSAEERMSRLAQRPDVRQEITTRLTGLKPKMARNLEPNLQASLIDKAVNDGDVELKEFEECFDPKILAVYMDTSLVWKHFMENTLPDIVAENTAREKTFVAFLLDVFLKDRGVSLRPILTHLDVRRAIDPTVWQSRIPLERRVAVDKARLDQERKSERIPFTAKQELAIVTLPVIVEALDLTDLVPIIRTAGERMGYVDDALGTDDITFDSPEEQSPKA